LVSGSADSTVRWWPLDGSPSRVLDGFDGAVSALEVSHDGKQVAAASGNTIRLWEPATGRRRALVAHSGAVYDLAFSPDGALLASASEDRTVMVWDVANGHPAQLLRGHSGPINRVIFAADSGSVYSASDDGSVRRWPLDPATGPNTAEALLRWLNHLSTVVVGEDGRARTPAFAEKKTASDGPPN
jgi:WD40 repeat protein